MTYQHALDNNRDLGAALATTSIDGKFMFKIMMRDEHWTFRCYLCCMSVGPATADAARFIRRRIPCHTTTLSSRIVQQIEVYIAIDNR
jgi:hypothetical protein